MKVTNSHSLWNNFPDFIIFFFILCFASLHTHAAQESLFSSDGALTRRKANPQLPFRPVIPPPDIPSPPASRLFISTHELNTRLRFKITRPLILSPDMIPRVEANENQSRERAAERLFSGFEGFLKMLGYLPGQYSLTIDTKGNLEKWYVRFDCKGETDTGRYMAPEVQEFISVVEQYFKVRQGKDIQPSRVLDAFTAEEI